LFTSTEVLKYVQKDLPSSLLPDFSLEILNLTVIHFFFTSLYNTQNNILAFPSQPAPTTCITHTNTVGSCVEHSPYSPGYTRNWCNSWCKFSI